MNLYSVAESGNVSDKGYAWCCCRLQRVMAYTVGQREAERCIGVGHLYTPAEALQAGLVDRVVPSDQLQRLTEAEMARWLHVPGGCVTS